MLSVPKPFPHMLWRTALCSRGIRLARRRGVLITVDQERRCTAAFIMTDQGVSAAYIEIVSNLWKNER
jgi:N-acetylglutamate synthase/N-acetylornithine aminotransferase